MPEPIAHPEDHVRYSNRYLRFVQAHREAYDAGYLDGNPQAAANELERLDREYQTLPPRHVCTCWPSHCAECLRMSKQRVDAPSAVEIGRSGHRPHPPMPSPLLLDINAGYTAA